MIRSKRINILSVAIVIVLTIVSYSVNASCETCKNSSSGIFLLGGIGASGGYISSTHSYSLFSFLSLGYSFRDTTIAVLCFLDYGFSRLIVDDCHANAYTLRAGGKIVIKDRIGIAIAEEWISLLDNKIYYPVISLSSMELIGFGGLYGGVNIDYFPDFKGINFGFTAKYRFNL